MVANEHYKAQALAALYCRGPDHARADPALLPRLRHESSRKKAAPPCVAVHLSYMVIGHGHENHFG